MISHLCLAAWYLLSSRDSLLLTQRTRFVSSLKPQFCVLDMLETFELHGELDIGRRPRKSMTAHICLIG
ncbi:hypothetical protein Bca4012_006148 [Brassica carinata]|uniref:Uncharacterized protein n=1 Tax=Brassica oleracea TaxID=3712 RepID=A0A3P6AVA0_BRAOL|nr:unnamed protein product [Brassica oleracea]